MTDKVEVVKEDTSVSEIANIMMSSNINRVPVTDEKGGLVGIITRRDIVKSMIKKDK